MFIISRKDAKKLAKARKKKLTAKWRYVMRQVTQKKNLKNFAKLCA
jgi:hypothetical protein